jgi:hypothetical protein
MEDFRYDVWSYPVEGIRMASAALKKEKKTFSLSREAVSYLKEAHQETQKSASEILEELILEKKLQTERDRISAAITNYYDSLTDEEIQTDNAWGRVGESQMIED